MKSFEQLIQEAEQAHFEGWDFSWLQGRQEETPPPWDYRSEVVAAAASAHSLLDMDTGGGEFLAAIPNRPANTWATENWELNIPIAEARLNPLGIQVKQMGEDGSLPFTDESFDLIINRHGGYHCAELMRVLTPGGIFITQQVGAANHQELNAFLAPGIWGLFSGEEFTIGAIVEKFTRAGFKLLRAEEAGTPAWFYDIGAVVYYLKVISWQIEGFSIEAYREPLRSLDELIRQEGSFECISERQLLIAQKPFRHS